MTSRLRLPLLGCASLVLLVGGCGGDGPGQDLAVGQKAPAAAAPAAPVDGTAAEPATSSGVPEAEQPALPTRTAFLREGNRICAEGSAALAVIGEATDGEDEQALLSVIADEVVPNIRGQVAGLRALGYPAGDARRLSAILDDTDAVLDAWAADPAMAFTDAQMEAVNDRLDDYGLTSCGDS